MEMVSKVKIAGKQLLKRPTLLFEVIQKANLSALWIPDQKRILIDAEKPKLKHRWNEAHEIGHSIAPWHNQYLFGDTDVTLSPSFCEQIEGEANYVAGSLLFMQSRFVDEALACPVNIGTIQSLAKTFGNTKTSTLWRFIEEAHGGKALVGIITKHPSLFTTNNTVQTCKHCVESPIFKKTFSKVSEKELYTHITGYCSKRTGGFLGESEIILRDDNGDDHQFHFESFSNTYEVLTIGEYQKPYSHIF
jgi:hypothetical protein